MIVSGSAIISSKEPQQVISVLKESVNKWIDINWSNT
jgi:hypothetical protein